MFTCPRAGLGGDFNGAEALFRSATEGQRHVGAGPPAEGDKFRHRRDVPAAHEGHAFPEERLPVLRNLKRGLEPDGHVLGVRPEKARQHFDGFVRHDAAGSFPVLRFEVQHLRFRAFPAHDREGKPRFGLFRDVVGFRFPFRTHVDPLDPRAAGKDRPQKLLKLMARHALFGNKVAAGGAGVGHYSSSRCASAFTNSQPRCPHGSTLATR